MKSALSPSEASGPTITLPARTLLVFLRGYQLLVSPIFTALGTSCRFHPTCSAYAVAVIRKDGAWRGSLRALSRLSRCHPWHPGGIDPP